MKIVKHTIWDRMIWDKIWPIPAGQTRHSVLRRVEYQIRFPIFDILDEQIKNPMRSILDNSNWR